MGRNRTIACTLMLAILLGGIGQSAAAVTPVRHALLARHETVQLARQVRRQETRLGVSLRRRVAAIERAVVTRFIAAHAEVVRRPATVAAAGRLLAIARARLHSLGRKTRRRLHVLHARYASLQGWLDDHGILRVCPVPSFTDISDTFGMMVHIPHVPVHRHEGNDIAAPYGAPILAPFDGLASTGRDTLGGLTVRVFGADGYVYNAHLSRLGQLGWVRAGDVIGYIGTTGDATSPHDHLEWHPNDGPAVDPHALLVAACVNAATGP